MIELCCEYLLVWCIWLYVIILPHMQTNLSEIYVNEQQLLAALTFFPFFLSNIYPFLAF